MIRSVKLRPFLARYAAACVLSLAAACTSSKAKSDAGTCGPAACSASSKLACQTGQICIGDGPVFEYHATCVPTCTTTSDCAQGRCAVLFDDVGVRGCVSDTVPQACSDVTGAFSCILVPAYCFKDGTLLRPFTNPSNRTCGYEAIACPNGCGPGVDGGSDAACK